MTEERREAEGRTGRGEGQRGRGDGGLTLTRHMQRHTRHSTAAITASRAPPTHTPIIAPRGKASASSALYKHNYVHSTKSKYYKT